MPGFLFRYVREDETCHEDRDTCDIEKEISKRIKGEFPHILAKNIILSLKMQNYHVLTYLLGIWPKTPFGKK